ncbi:cystine transport system substrate-binding protein [Faunimonas pinastri]|uniref:Cystine transport system substrate-binding protein n=1 Tax=Faunimonas pinastri TaxID=1855383 RepID=A0A1H9AJJ0_9HYPH|nr:cystine ABC transporter substrate-binding protein [Faunimonas pinastri]SEP76829.1 cystine transport system substrate-binding protein [Faunimonas pinastri]
MTLFRLRPLFAAACVLLASSLAIDAASAADRLDEVKSRGALVVGLEGTYPPFSFQDESGNLVGFEVDLSKALADKMGVKAQFQPTKWDGILAALQSGRLDVVVNQVTITDERKKTISFSDPYTVSGIQIIVRKGEESKINKPDDLQGKAVGVGLGTNYEQWLRQNEPKAEVRTYDDDPTKISDLVSGRIDAVLNDRLVAADLVKKSGGTIVGAGEPFSKQEAGIAIAKGNPELLAAVNKALGELRQDGTLAEISDKWFGTDVTK